MDDFRVITVVMVAGQEINLEIVEEKGKVLEGTSEREVKAKRNGKLDLAPKDTRLSSFTVVTGQNCCGTIRTSHTQSRLTFA